ncbi:hypothetical protein FRC00_011660 [Tulasnella sp. 408]|nr:hypothetical protein FRC00_011660 [Tulasnella sp. 408]
MCAVDSQATGDREHEANQTFVEVITTNQVDEMTDGTGARMPQTQFSYIIRSIAEWLVESQIQRQHKRPGNPQTLRKHAIVHVFRVSGDPEALYYAAASVCCVEEQKSLHFIYSNEECRERLLLLFLDAVPSAQGEYERKALDVIADRQKDIVVLGTAIFHLTFSLGTSARLSEILDTGRKRTSPPTAERDSIRQVVHGLACLWYVRDDRLGQQRSVFTSTSLAAGLLLGCLGFNTPIFYEESRSLTYLLDSISSAEPDSWNQLALLALVCNTRGGRTMCDRIDAGFRRIQIAYIT